MTIAESIRVAEFVRIPSSFVQNSYEFRYLAILLDAFLQGWSDPAPIARISAASLHDLAAW